MFPVTEPKDNSRSHLMKKGALDRNAPREERVIKAQEAWSSKTLLMRSNAQSISSRVMTSGGAIRMT